MARTMVDPQELERTCRITWGQRSWKISGGHFPELKKSVKYILLPSSINRIYRKIKTSQGYFFTAPMASGGGLTDLILRCWNIGKSKPFKEIISPFHRRLLLNLMFWRIVWLWRIIGSYSQEMMWVFLCVGESIEKSGLCTITYILPNHTIKILFDYCHLPTAI